MLVIEDGLLSKIAMAQEEHLVGILPVTRCHDEQIRNAWIGRKLDGKTYKCLARCRPLKLI